MALTNLSQVTSSGIHTLSNYTTHNINSTGIITATEFSGNLSNSSGISTFAEIRVTGNLTVEGTTTTLDSNLTEVDRIEVGANSASPGIAVTQSGTGAAAFFNGGDVNIATGNLALASATPMIVASNGSGHLRLGAGGSEKVRITSAGLVGIGTDDPTTKLTINSLTTLSSDDDIGGVSIANTENKTYPTTSSFSVTLGLDQNNEVGGTQTIDPTTPGGYNYISGIKNALTKTNNNTQDVERSYYYGINQSFNWQDQNTCKQYVGINNGFTYAGINTNGRTSSSFNADRITLGPPEGGTQTLANATTKDLWLWGKSTSGTDTINITGARGKSVGLRFVSFSSGTHNYNITNYSVLETDPYWGTVVSTGTLNATITNYYGLKLTAPSSSTGLTVTNNYGIYSGWSDSTNYFAGKVGIGTVTPEEELSVQLDSSSDGPTLRLRNANGGDGTYTGRISTGDAYGTFFAGINFLKHDTNDGEIRLRTKVAGSNTDVLTIVDGNVGIGLTNPDWHLDIKSTSVNAVVRLKSSGSTNGGQLQVNSDDLILRNRDAGELQLWTNDSNKLTITSAGNVGVGDATPENTLSIKNIGSFEGDANSFYLGSNFTGTGQNFSGSGKHAQRFFFNNASGNGYLRYENTGTSTGNAGDAITWQERFRIDSNGRLSLNDNSRPASDANEGAQLRVTGTPLTRNQYYSPAGDYFGSFGYTDDTYTKSWIAVDSSYNKTSAVSSGIFLSAFHADAGGSACGHTIKNVRTDAGGLIFSSVATGSVNNPAVETERLRIDSSGRLLKSGQAALTSTSLSHPIQIAADSDAQNIACFGRASDDISAIDFYEADKTTNLGEIQYRRDHVNFRHRVGYISFATGGVTERFRIKSDGKAYFTNSIGLDGQTSPGASIHINNFGNSGYELKLTGNALQFNRTSSSYIDQLNDTGSILFRMGSSYTEAMRITSDGRVSINYNNPNSWPQLTVKQTGADIGGTADTNSNTRGLQLWQDQNDNKSIGLWFTTGGHLSGISGQRSNYSSHWGTDLRFYTHSPDTQNVTQAYERLRITDNGYLGINHTSPGTRLVVKQNNGVAYNNRAQSVAYGAAAFINESGHTSGGTYTGFQFNMTGNSQNRICAIGAITHSSSDRTSSLVFATDEGGNRTEKLRIAYNGHLSMPAGGAIYSTHSGNTAITPSANDWIDVARIPYGAEIAGEVIIRWANLHAPSCCHHGHMRFDIGSSHGPTYNYQWSASLSMTEAQAHNTFWFKAARLIIQNISGSNYLYLQVQANTSVSSGTFRNIITRSKRTIDAATHIEYLTPNVSNRTGTIARYLLLQNAGSEERVTTPHTNKIQNALGGNVQVEGSLNIGGHLSWGGYIVEKVGEKLGTGTYTVFTNGNTSTQSGGIVEIMAIYGTPSGAGYWKYKISGNRNVYLMDSNTTGYGGHTPALAWNGANLEVSNSNSSTYYTVHVKLFQIGIGWGETWGNLPGIGN